LDKMVHKAQANSGECKHQAAQSREELDAVGLRWQELQKEFGIVEAATRSGMKDLQRALQEAREELNRREPEPERHDAVGAAVVASLDPPNVGVVPADELAPEAQDRLVRYLNDAASVERELAGLLQMLADASDDPVLRTEFEQHRKL